MGASTSSFWASRDGPTNHCCSWLLLVEVVGQKLGLSGAACWACGYPCAQPLSANLPFVTVPQDTHIRLMQGRLCMAIQLGVHCLHDWYSSSAILGLTANTQATFPFQQSFSVGEQRVEFTYKGPFIHGLKIPIFPATRNDTGKAWWSTLRLATAQPEVHQALADCNMAPDIYAHGETVGGMIMVVIEYIEGDWWPAHPSTKQRKRISEL